MSTKCCHCGGVLRDLMFLPISRRGHFFQDSFFSNIHQDFNTAVKRVLEGWADTDLQLPGFDLNHTDILDRYRQLRSRNLKEENQAVTVASDNTSHKMVVDVQDFTGGDVKVKVVDEKELVVEGRVEKTGDGGSSVSTHTFRRRFSLPNQTDVNAISSAISSDGILTITAPKLEISGPKTTVIPIQMEGGSNAPKLQQQFSCESCYDTAPREYRVPIQLEDATPDNTQSKTTTVPIQMESATPANIQSRTTTVPIQMENSTPNNTQPRTTIVPIQLEDAPPDNTQPRTTKTNTMATEAETHLHSFPKYFLPVTRSGLFFGDAYFQDIWDHFNRAVCDVLAKWGDQSAIADHFTSYRNLRSQNLSEENQAVTSSEDEHQHKFAIDVKDFVNGGEVKVKAVNDCELVVEGCLDKQGDGAKSSKRFHRRFVVPGHIHLDAVTSALSSDGVLTITAPKKDSTIQICDVTSPQPTMAAAAPKLQQKDVHEQPSLSAKVGPVSAQPISTATFVPQHQQNDVQFPSSGIGAGIASPPATTQAYIVEEPETPRVTADQANHTEAVPLNNGAPSAVVAPLYMTSPSPNVILAKPASHQIPTNVIAEEAANKARMFVPVAAEGEEAADPQSLYKTKNTGKFPIKIGGSIINTNSV